MAHHSATKKSIKQIAKRTERNISIKNRVRSAENKADESNKALKNAQRELDRGVTKGIFKKKSASRLLSRLNKAVKTISQK